MNSGVSRTIETPRLILRPWRLETDLEPFFILNSDPQVMKYFTSPLIRAESDALVLKIFELIEQQGWGFWTIELKETHHFIGFCGLHSQPDLFDFSPCVEIGWRLDKNYWGKGYAFEAAQAALNFAFTHLKLDAVVAFTAIQNKPSEKLMQRLGMSFQSTFKHPKLPEESPLQSHVLYKINSPS